MIRSTDLHSFNESDFYSDDLMVRFTSELINNTMSMIIIDIHKKRVITRSFFLISAVVAVGMILVSVFA